jgi:CheY-like chemotaxis protein
VASGAAVVNNRGDIRAEGHGTGRRRRYRDCKSKNSLQNSHLCQIKHLRTHASGDYSNFRSQNTAYAGYRTAAYLRTLIHVGFLHSLLARFHSQPGRRDTYTSELTGMSESSSQRDESSIRILSVTNDPRERDQLKSLAEFYGWNTVFARDHVVAAQILRTEPFPIVICDRDTLNTDWRHAFETLLRPDRFKCLILCSAVDDDYLWQDVIHHGGYDVIRKPIDEDQAVRAIQFAWAFWKTVLAKHHPRRATQE